MAYVYRHIRIDKNVPFYIGIGGDDEGKYLRAYHGIKSRRCSNIWKRIVAKTHYEVEILFDNISWDEACKKEIEFIALYGRIDKNSGTLANQTDGGEGVLGLIQSPESIKRSTDKRRGRVQSAEERAKRCDAMKKRGKLSEETKMRISVASKGRKFSEETRLKISTTLKERSIRLGKVITQKPKYASREEAEAMRRLKISEKLKGKSKSWKGIELSKERRKHLKESCKSKKAVIQYTITREFIAEYDSQREAQKITGIPKESIGRACRRWGNYKNGICNGFIWEHKK